MLTKLTAEDETALQDRLSAYHEAAHCVIAYRVGWTITPEKGIQLDDQPMCWVRYPRLDQTSFRMLYQLLAGHAAETILMPERVKMATFESLSDYQLPGLRHGWLKEEAEEYGDILDDDTVALDIIMQPCPDRSDEEIFRIYKDHFEEVTELLQEPDTWAAVERIAAELLKVRHIGDPKRIEALIAGPEHNAILPATFADL